MVDRWWTGGGQVVDRWWTGGGQVVDGGVFKRHRYCHIYLENDYVITSSRGVWSASGRVI